MEYTTVLGVDKNHVEHLRLVWPTWQRHKPDIFDNPMIIFYDHGSTDRKVIEDIVQDHPRLDILVWPVPSAAPYLGDPSIGRFGESQREKMLSGFVYVPAYHVSTPYWLKLDLDVVASGMPCWIDPTWFHGYPAIVAHRWSYTKPANQMQVLDDWVTRNPGLRLAVYPPLNMIPKPDATSLPHQRIISWCGFFKTDFTRFAAQEAFMSCGPGHLPVPSQDGYLMYVAQRRGLPIHRVNMKARGWIHCSRLDQIKSAVGDSLA